MNPTIHTVPVPDGSLHVPVYGSEHSVPIILLHGTAAYHYCWRYVAAQLATSYRAYCPDLLGSGFSDKPKDALYSKRAQADRILALLASLDIGPVHLIGHSLGGEVATHIALAAPDQVRSLTLVAPDGLRRGVIPPVRWLARRGWLDGLFRQAMHKPMKPAALARILGLPLEQLTPSFIAEWTKPYADPNLPYVIAKTLADDDTGMLTDRIHQLAMPTLLIHGTKDRMIPSRVFERYQQLVPSLRTEVYEGYGHVLMEQCPERLAASVAHFIGEIAG
ncbi:alpha/beta fold hydrolase [Paenibacillus guangzhouensis]|uniref:alpha/beta fold hydrolase n=1 Tax=Paenibacillus guangzhouensis TaxID=1473112 RepID=UPI0012671B0C|nr:alpha/beta fold hydrolase [Paenibacillus guangzhouensis]